jgi:crotonobetainyl-CoA:carnitine CoA-transferase CaiB-like acyl-CoA transferase
MDNFKHREAIKAELSAHLEAGDTEVWMEAMIAADIWAAPVMDWDETLNSGVLQSMGMLQDVQRGELNIKAMSMPMRIDGEQNKTSSAAPRLGQDNMILSNGWRGR